MLINQIKEKYRVELVAEIMAHGKRQGRNPEEYLVNVLNTTVNPQRLIDEPNWGLSHHGFDYWRGAFNEHGLEQR